MPPIVKICGLMRVVDVRLCIGHGADMVGFVADYPQPNPWNIKAALVKELITGGLCVWLWMIWTVTVIEDVTGPPGP